MRIVLIGQPGSGKGTQSEALSKHYSIPHLSSGDMMRRALQDKTALGEQVRKFVNSGKLVPDQIIVKVLHKELSQSEYTKGFILDGYPRNVSQARDLDHFLNELDIKLDKAIYLSIDEKLILDRLSGRRISASGKLYNVIYNRPKVIDKCDIDGSDLVQREDDKPDRVLTRIKIFIQQASLILDYYRELKLLAEIEAGQAPDLVTNDIVDCLS